MLVPLHSQIYYKMLVPLNSHIYYKILLKIPIQGANNILCVCFYMCVMHFKIPTKRLQNTYQEEFRSRKMKT